MKKFRNKLVRKIYYLFCILSNKGYLVVRRLRRKLKIKSKCREKTRYGYVLFDLKSTQNSIANLILSGQPFMVGRIGNVECNICNEAVGISLGLKEDFSDKWGQKFHLNAGFFPVNHDNLMRFAEIMENAVASVDIIGSMKINPEKYILKRTMNAKTIVTEIGCLEPYYSNTPWTRALEGKKVLVIHPFADTILKQYEKRELLFPTGLLPKFELKVYKAVQSIAGTKTSYNDWFEALDAMTNEIVLIDFDVAIIGCGAYGFPLAARIKKAGKQAIHLGGAVQILFGIKGERWNSVPQVRQLYNEHWTSPSTEETPERAKMVEGGCYW